MTTRDALQPIVTKILKAGPDRVVVDDSGFAVTPRRAKRDYGRSTIDVIFIRRDGYSVGACQDLAAAAERLWRDHWIGILRPPATVAEPYHKAPPPTEAA